MLKFEKTTVYNFEDAFYGMRNAMESWEKSDSYVYGDLFVLGEKDKKLAHNLIKAGVSDRKFLRQIQVSVRFSAPRYFWVEWDTYTVGTSKNSGSTMHRIMSKPITQDMFSINPDSLEEPYEANRWDAIIADLNYLRDKYNDTGDIKYFYRMKERLPESYMQFRSVTLNYEVIYKMIRERKNHRLPEWRCDFIEWAKGLPYAKELLFYEG